MEKLILTYCILLLLLVFLVLGLLLWDTEKPTEKSVAVKDNLLLACSSLLGFIILHMNWLLLSWSTDNYENMLAISTMIILSILCSVPAVYLLKNLIQSRAIKDKKAQWKIFVSDK